jgi:integrase
VIERDKSGDPTVWHLYPTGRSVPYFGSVRKGDLAAERRAIGRFLRWKAEQDGTPWEQCEGNTPHADAMFAGMMYIRERDQGKRRVSDLSPGDNIQNVIDRRAAKLATEYATKYREFIRNLILTDPRKAAAELEIDQLAWLNDLKPPAPSLSLREIGDVYFNRTLKGTEHWERKMRRVWQEFEREVGVTYIGELIREHIVQYRDAIQTKGKSRAFVVHRFGGVKAILRHAQSEVEHPKEISRVVDLCSLLKLPRKSQMKPKPIKRNHFHALLDAVEREPKWKAIFLLALNAAMYPSEVAAVKKVDIDFAEGTLSAERGKTGVPRVAVLWKRTIDAIVAYQAAEPHESEYLFVSRTGVRFSDNHVSRNFCRRRDSAGLPRSVQFAHIRDGAYSAAYNAQGVGEKEAKVLAGHRSGMTDHYVTRSPSVVTAACAAIEHYYFGEVA